MDGFVGQTGAAGHAGLSLSDILQQSRKLTNQLGRDSDLPSIQLGIDQIESQSRKLASKSVRNGNPAADARAGGIDAAQLSNAIQHTNIANTFEPLQPVYDTDMEGFIQHEHEQVILSMIEESRRQTLDDFQHKLGDGLHQDWQNQKRRILEELGQHKLDEGDTVSGVPGGLSFRRSTTSMPSVPQSAADEALNASVLHSRIIRYDTVIARLNKARVDHEPIPLIHALMEIVEGIVQEPARKRGLLDAWTVLKYMVHEQGALPKPVQEREYAAAYMDLDAFHSAPGLALRKKWVGGARAYLEAQFAEYMEQVIAASPLQAQRGGVPTVRATVAAFLRAQLRTPQNAWVAGIAREMDQSTDTPLWANLFYLIRSGHASDALRCAHENEASLQRADPSFLAYFKAWIDAEDRQLPKSMREHLMAEYVTRFRSVALDAQDPYHYTLYRLMGRFDTAKKFPQPLVSSTENWLWLQLCMVTESAEGDAQDPTLRTHTLHDLAQKLEKYGEAHFDPKGTRPLHYFQLLLLVGEFEKAIAFLHARAAYQVDVVHFAIALTYYGLLRVPAASETSQFDYLTVVQRAKGPVALIDFAKLIQRYTRLFAQSSPRDAIAYISLLCLNAKCPAPVGGEQVQRCHELVRSLILEAPSSSFVELLGDVRADGTPVPGLIEQHLDALHLGDKREFVRKIVESAAKQCEREQRTTDAILLYNHIGEHDTVISVLNRELGATLMEPVSLSEWQTNVDAGSAATLSAVSSLVTLARGILASYEQQYNYRGAPGLVCQTLLGLKKAVSLYNDNQLLPALQTLEALHLLPLDAEARKDVVSITRKAEEFKTYDENITKNFSDIVLMAMTLLYKLHQELKNSITRSNSGALYEYRSQARALMMWAGMLRFRMSNETYSQLTRLDVYIH